MLSTVRQHLREYDSPFRIGLIECRSPYRKSQYGVALVRNRETAVHLLEMVAMFLISLLTRDRPLQLLTALMLLIKYESPFHP